MFDDVKFSLIVVGAVLAAALAVYRLRRVRHHGMDMGQRNLLATNFGFFSTLYTFFLGFAVVVLWQSYNHASTLVAAEAENILVEYRISSEIEEAGPFRQALLDYAGIVQGAGWDRMRQEQTDDGAGAAFDLVWSSLRRLRRQPACDPGTGNALLRQMIEIDAMRSQRLRLVDGNLYAPIWALIYLGVAFTIAVFYFVDTGNQRADIFFMVMMLCMILGNIFLLYELNTPFSGLICIGPDYFQEAYAVMKASGG
ncbi:hypothetical protein [Desulfolutivibrio sulfoxidireducens]|uniref:bestrophin-like domain n=1 Tax=Desulfolutivibrio sulfoxidireducens TaxID=2773299 RepID=UPI00159D61BB|nr:hypothetical protein [Desulfolutivibrio sulfoxidireducens]QLA14874.1 DUF4239 domain-containing protein [Desulfolutivibrio sulfoxidireducens]QLA18444.1 DUF4239 domain-containing protein [Desulfolutivibrio sulfoxidireducens]